MQHRLSDVLISTYDSEYDDHSTVIFENSNNSVFKILTKRQKIKNMFDSLFSNLFDKNGCLIGSKAVFHESYMQTIIKCDIENSIDLIYSLLSKHMEVKSMEYYRDIMDAEPSKDIIKVIELINHAHSHRIPRKYIAGFLLLMIRFIYFPLNN